VATEVRGLVVEALVASPAMGLGTTGLLVEALVAPFPTNVSNLFGTVVHDAPTRGGPPLQGDRIRTHYPLQGAGLQLPPGGS